MAAAVIALVGAGYSAYSKNKEGQDAQDQANTQAALDKQEGQSAEQVSLTQEATTRRNSREFLGRQAAAFAQADVGPGSSTAVQNQSSIDAELDALNVRYRGQLTKFGYDYNSQSQIAEGRAKRTTGQLNAGGALLKGASDYYNKGA